MTQRRIADPLYIYADPMKGAAHQPPAAGIIAGAAFSAFGVGTTVLGLGAFGSFLALSAVGLALNALAPKPRFPQSERGYAVTQFGPALDQQVIYGETRIAGARVFDGATGSNNKFLHRAIVFAGHEVEEFSEVYLNDYKLTVDLATGAVTSANNGVETTTRYNNRVRIIARNGTDNQTAIPEMIDEIPEWTSAHRLRGLAYLYIRLEFDADVFPNGVPEITATIKGKKVFDPRTSTTAWSANPALCIRDYLTNSRYGMGSTAGEIDDVLVAQAANVCEQTVESENRYTMNGAFTTDAAPADVLQNMLTSMGGLLWHAQGAWRMKPAYYTAPVLALGLDDLRGGLQIQTRAARRDNFNTVRGTFRGAESDWQVTDYKPVSDPAFVTADGGFDAAIDLDLPFTSSHLTAQRIARIALQQQREQVTVSGRFGLRAFQVQVGDNVTITNPRLGWTNKEFEVVTWTFTLTEDLALEVIMTLRETSEAVFTPVAGEVFEANNTALPSPFLNVAPQNLQAVTSAFIATDGTYVNSIDVTWDAPDDAFVDHYEIEWRKTTVTEFSGATTSAAEFIIPSVDDDSSYAIRVRAVNVLGVRGPFTSLTFNAGPDITPPGDPSAFTAEGDLGFINLRWTNPPDRDLDYTEVWESETSGFGDATQIAESYGDTFNRGNLSPLVTRYYWVRAVDASGNKSGFVGPVNATTRQIQTGDIGPAVIQYDDFASDVTDLFDGIIADVSDRVLISDYNITVEYQQQLEHATTQLATDALALALNASSLESRVNNAGITVDPATGSVTIQGLSAVEDRVNNVEIDLDAVEGQLTLKATTTYVNNAIAAATLPEATLAALEDLEARVDTVEIDLNSVEGSITLTSTGSLYNVNDGVLGVEALEGRITVNEGEIALKAAQTELDDVETRLGSAEITLNALDVPSITLAVQDVRTISNKQDDLGELTLKEVLGRYNDREYVLRDVAFARQELTADVNEQGEAVATITTELQAQINDNVASILSEQQTRATADSALAFDITQISAQVNDPDTGLPAAQASITNLEQTKVTAEQAESIALSQITASLESEDEGTIGASINTLEQTKVDASGAVAAVNTEIGVEFNGITGLVTQTSDLVVDVDGIEGRHGVTIDNNGNITGYQLLSGAAGSAFNVRADQFAVFNSTGAGGSNPFTVFTSPRTVGGVVFPAGTYIQDAFIDRASIVDGTIATAKIEDAAITTAKIDDLQVDTAKIKDSAITTAKIGDLQVDTIKVAGNAISSTVSGVAVNAVTVQLTVPAVADGQPVSLITTFTFGGGFFAQHDIKRNGVTLVSRFVNDSSGAISFVDNPGAGTHTYTYTQSNPNISVTLSITAQLIKR